MVHENNAPIVVVERGTRRVVSAPVRVFDRRVIVIVVVMDRQMNVRRRQQGRDNSRSGQQRGSSRPAEAGGDHARESYST